MDEIAIEFARDCYNSGQESDVDSFITYLLNLAEKDPLHGYKVIHQKHIASGIPDIIVELRRGEQKVGVIECKSRSNHVNLVASVLQISNYMAIDNYPNGLLIDCDTAKFYTNNNEDYTQNPEESTLNYSRRLLSNIDEISVLTYQDDNDIILQSCNTIINILRGW